MKFPSTVVIALCSLTLVGCNQLTQLGAKSLVFEEDPFTQLEQAQQAATSPQQPPVAMDGSAAGQYSYQPNQPARRQASGSAEFDPNAGLPVQNWDTPQQTNTTTAYMPHSVTSGPAASGPVARAEATVAALMAQQQRPIQQAGFETRAETPGVATFDFGSPAQQSAAPEFERRPQFDGPAQSRPQFDAPQFGSDPFQAVDTTPANPVVPQPHSPTFELNESLLDLPTVQQPTRDPNKFPGTNIPIPAGKASVFLDVMEDAFEPVPQTGMTPPMSPAGQQPPPVVTQPVFTQPTRTDGRSLPQPTGRVAIPATQPAVAPVVVPPTSTRPRREIIHDSRNDSKWRAARRR